MEHKPYASVLIYPPEEYQTVQKIAEYLTQKAKFRLWFDQWVIVVGETWERNLRLGFAQSSSCIVFIGKSGRAPWHKTEVEALLQRQAANPAFRVIPVLLPGATMLAEIPEFLIGRAWITFQDEIDSDTLRQLELAIRGVTPKEGHNAEGKPNESIAPVHEKKTPQPVQREETLPADFYQTIVDFLNSLPNINEKQTRRALIEMAGFSKALKHQLNCDEPPATFSPLLVSTLSAYGDLPDGQHALVALLEAAKQYVGQEKQTLCEKLIQQFKTIPFSKLTSVDGQPLDRRAKRRRRMQSVAWSLLIFLIGGVIGVVGTVISTEKEWQKNLEGQRTSLKTALQAQQKTLEEKFQKAKQEALTTALQAQKDAIQEQKETLEQDFQKIQTAALQRQEKDLEEKFQRERRETERTYKYDLGGLQAQNDSSEEKLKKANERINDLEGRLKSQEEDNKRSKEELQKKIEQLEKSDGEIKKMYEHIYGNWGLEQSFKNDCGAYMRTETARNLLDRCEETSKDCSSEKTQLTKAETCQNRQIELENEKNRYVTLQGCKR